MKGVVNAVVLYHSVLSATKKHRGCCSERQLRLSVLRECDILAATMRKDKYAVSLPWQSMRRTI